EDWNWCYLDEVAFRLDWIYRDDAHPALTAPPVAADTHEGSQLRRRQTRLIVPHARGSLRWGAPPPVTHTLVDHLDVVAAATREVRAELVGERIGVDRLQLAVHGDQRHPRPGCVTAFSRVLDAAPPTRGLLAALESAGTLSPPPPRRRPRRTLGSAMPS